MHLFMSVSVNILRPAFTNSSTSFCSFPLFNPCHRWFYPFWYCRYSVFVSHVIFFPFIVFFSMPLECPASFLQLLIDALFPLFFSCCFIICPILFCISKRLISAIINLLVCLLCFYYLDIFYTFCCLQLVV